jgi:D-alanyl-lipoteichoic acid acyltransferase DltB (MBOAT superfamily)
MQNFYVEYSFFIAAIVAIVLFRVVSHSCSLLIRQVTFIACNLYFLSQLSGSNRLLPLTMVYALVILSAGYFMHKNPSKVKKTIIFRSGLIFCLGLLLAFKYPSYTSLIFGNPELFEHLSAIEWIGLSYLSFRAIDFLLIQRSGRVEYFSFISVFSYLTFFAPFVSGPINRSLSFFKDFSGQPTALNFVRVRSNLLRISIGIIKILFLSKWAYANSIIAPEFQYIQPVSWWILTLSIYAYFFYIYLEFSGYCDVAIAISDFFDIKIPENFEYPMFAGNIQDFWNRWHITLSHWMRDHFFFPLLMYFVSRFKFLPKILFSCVSIFSTFILIGAWHGDKLHWVLYGAYHGLGLSVYMLYNNVLNTKASVARERLRDNPVYKAICIFLTFNFVAWGLLLTLDFQDASRVLSPPSSQWSYHLKFEKEREQPYQSQGLVVKESSDSFTFEPKTNAQGIAYFQLGGTHLDRLKEGEGWPMAMDGKYQAKLEGEMFPVGEVEIQVLIYGKEGTLLKKKNMGYFRSYSLPMLFDFEGEPGAERFTILLSSPLSDWIIKWPQHLQLNSLEIKQIR